MFVFTYQFLGTRFVSTYQFLGTMFVSTYHFSGSMYVSTHHFLETRFVSTNHFLGTTSTRKCEKNPNLKEKKTKTKKSIYFLGSLRDPL